MARAGGRGGHRRRGRAGGPRGGGGRGGRGGGGGPAGQGEHGQHGGRAGRGPSCSTTRPPRAGKIRHTGSSGRRSSYLSNISPTSHRVRGGTARFWTFGRIGRRRLGRRRSAGSGDPAPHHQPAPTAAPHPTRPRP